MKPLKISYSYYAKYKDHLYCRVRQAGVRTMDVNLHTNDKAKAETYVKLRRAELDMYNSYILAGEPVPEEVERKLLRRGASVAGQTGSGAIPLLTTALDAWEQELLRQGKRERTVESYCKQVRLTIPSGSVTTDINRKSVRTWLASHDNTKTSTRKAYSVALREFTKFCISEYGVDPNVINDWPMVKVQQEEKGFWTMTQMYHLIEAIKCQDNPEQEEAMKVYCWLMATTGARQGEAGMLKWSDYKDGAVTFRAETTKSNKSRRVPLDMRICQMIDKLPRKNQYIFASIPKGQPGRYALVAKAVRRSGVPAGGLHSFRHSACMYLYSRCSDIKAIAQMVGHSPAVSLQYYVKSRQVDELRSIVKDAYEGENMIPNAMDELIKAGMI